MNAEKVHLRLRANRPFVDAQVLDGPRKTATAYMAGDKSHPDLRRWDPRPGSADADLLPEHGTIRSRSRDLARNHGVAEGAVQTYVDNILGSQLRMKSRPPWKALAKIDSRWNEDYAEEWSNGVEAQWCGWAESTWCDAARMLDFHGLTVQAFRSRIVNGEALVLPQWLDEDGASAATCLQLVEPDRLCNPFGQPERDGLRGGIETGFYGAALAYHVMKRHPGDAFFSYSQNYWGIGVYGINQWERIPATTPWGRKRVIHWHEQERTGQSRGKPSLTSVLRNFKVLGDYSNAELKAAVVNAKVALTTEGILSQEQLLELLSDNADARKWYVDSLSNRGRSSTSLNDGLIVPLPLGEKIGSFTPGRPSTAFEAFVLALFRQIAAGLNIPYELLLKDFSKTNYSSARAALLEAWRFFRGVRKQVITYWCKPVYDLWFEEQVMEGRIDAPDFYQHRALYLRSKWIGDGRGWVDPLKEAEAAGERMANLITTLEDECSEQGTDWEENIEIAERIAKRMKKAGLTAPWMAPDPAAVKPAAAAPAKATESQDDADRRETESVPA